jgi:flagellar protein FlaG
MAGTSNIPGITTTTPLNPLSHSPSGELGPHSELSSAPPRPHNSPEPEITADQLREVVESLEDAIAVINRSVRFKVDDSTDTLITQVVNRDTNEVIRQIPPEEMLAIARRLREFIGLFLNIEV